MSRLRKANKVIQHSTISEAIVVDHGAKKINEKSLKFDTNGGLVSKVNKSFTKMNKEDLGGFDYGRLVAIIAKS